MKRLALLTGAGGFVGRRCVALLRGRGFEVQAISRAQCDLLDGAACEALMERIRPSHLLHLAWVATPGEFWQSPENHRWQAAGERLLQRFFATGGERAVGVGSCAEYAASSAPCREDATPVAPQTPYGVAKSALCAALERAARGHGSWAWARLFFPYGPGEAPGRFIPSVISGLLRREAVACTHGRQVRDFVYVDDVAQACAALLDNAAAGGIYNLGSGEGRSLREVGGAIAAELGGASLLRFGERQPPDYDPPTLVADIAKIHGALGWTPRVGFTEGIRRSIAAARDLRQGAR